MNLGPLELVPRWLYVAAFTILATAYAVQAERLSTAQVKIAKLETQIETQRADAERVAREHTVKMAALQADHARKQQDAETQFADFRARAEARAASDAAVVGRLRKQISGYTAPGRGFRPGSDAVAGVGKDHRLETVGSLLAEGVELLVEGRAILERREAEVIRLASQVEIDRAACQAGDKAPN